MTKFLHRITYIVESDSEGTEVARLKDAVDNAGVSYERKEESIDMPTLKELSSIPAADWIEYVEETRFNVFEGWTNDEQMAIEKFLSDLHLYHVSKN